MHDFGLVQPDASDWRVERPQSQLRLARPARIPLVEFTNEPLEGGLWKRWEDRTIRAALGASLNVSLNPSQDTVNWMVTSSESVGAMVAMGVERQGKSVVPASNADAHVESKAQPTGDAPITSSTLQVAPQLVEVKVVGPKVATVIHPVQVP